MLILLSFGWLSRLETGNALLVILLETGTSRFHGTNAVSLIRQHLSVIAALLMNLDIVMKATVNFL